MNAFTKQDIPDSLQDQVLSLNEGFIARHGPWLRGRLSSYRIQCLHGLFSLPVFIQDDDCQIGHQDLFNALCPHVIVRPKLSCDWKEML